MQHPFFTSARLVSLALATALAGSGAIAQQGVPSKAPDANPKAITVAPTRLPSPSQPGGSGRSLLDRKNTLLNRRSSPLGNMRPPAANPSNPSTPNSPTDPTARNGLNRRIYGPGPVPPNTGGPLVPIDRILPGNDSGLIVNGRIDTDRLRIALLNNRYNTWPWRNHCYPPDWNNHDHDHDQDHDHGHGHHFPGNWWGNSWWGGRGSRYWWNDTPEVVYSGPWYGVDPFVASGQVTGAAANQPPAQAAPRTLTTIELADQAWRNGETPDAIRYFRDYMDQSPDDQDALRYLALALIDDRKVDQAVAVMAMAYHKAPRLTTRPLDPDDLPGGDIEFRKRLNAVSIFASKVKTSSAWFTLAVMMQAEGRQDVAGRILDRAKAAGLDSDLAASFEQALR